MTEARSRPRKKQGRGSTADAGKTNDLHDKLDEFDEWFGEHQREDEELSPPHRHDQHGHSNNRNRSKQSSSAPRRRSSSIYVSDSDDSSQEEVKVRSSGPRKSGALESLMMSPVPAKSRSATTGEKEEGIQKHQQLHQEMEKPK